MLYLDDNDMVRMLPRLIQDAIAGDHVINHIALRDLLRPEGLWCRKVHAVIVPKMVVANN